jgi:hypothetical protein
METLSGRAPSAHVLRKRLEGGGSGQMYCTQHSQLGRAYVVKSLDEARWWDADDAVTRLRREVQLASTVRQENAVHGHDFSVASTVDEVMWIARWRLVQPKGLIKACHANTYVTPGEIESLCAYDTVPTEVSIG